MTKPALGDLERPAFDRAPGRVRVAQAPEVARLRRLSGHVECWTLGASGDADLIAWLNEVRKNPFGSALISSVKS